VSRGSDDALRTARTPALVSCSGKHRFDNQRLARDVAKRSNRQRKQGVSAYRCGHCGGWHIGTHIGTHGSQHHARRRRPRDINHLNEELSE